MRDRGLDVLAVANPLRSVAGDATYLRDVIAGLGRPVVLAGHSYGGMVISEAAADNPAIQLVAIEKAKCQHYLIYQPFLSI